MARLHFNAPLIRGTGTQDAVIHMPLAGGGSHGAHTWGSLTYLAEVGFLDKVSGMSAVSAGGPNMVCVAKAIAEGKPSHAPKYLDPFWDGVKEDGAMVAPMKEVARAASNQPALTSAFVQSAIAASNITHTPWQKMASASEAFRDTIRASTVKAPNLPPEFVRMIRTLARNGDAAGIYSQSSDIQRRIDTVIGAEGWDLIRNSKLDLCLTAAQVTDPIKPTENLLLRRFTTKEIGASQIGASASLITPHKIDGLMYMDGGFLENTAISNINEQRYTDVVALMLAHIREPLIPALQEDITLTGDKLFGREMAQEIIFHILNGSSLNWHVLPSSIPEHCDDTSKMNFTPRTIDSYFIAGYEAAQQWHEENKYNIGNKTTFTPQIATTPTPTLETVYEQI